MAPVSPPWTARSRSRVGSARVARLATVRPDGSPHLVPVTFALQDDTVVTAIDDKPKTTAALQRLENIEAEARVSLLVDHYDDEDWTRLWWVRLDGRARVVRDGGERPGLLAPLLAKYPQYVAAPPRGPVVVLTIGAVREWSAT